MTTQTSQESSGQANQLPVTLFSQLPVDNEITELSLEAQIKTAYRLRFPGEDERRFQVFYSKISLLFSRVTLLVAIVGYIVFGLADLWSLPITYPKAWFIRYALICPLYTVVWALSFQVKWSKLIPKLAGMTHLFGAVGLMAIMAIALPSEVGHSMYFLGLVFVILAVHFSRLRFGYATFLGWTMMLFYTGFGIWKAMVLQSSAETAFLIGNVFYLSFMNIAGMFISYILEVSARIEFLQRQALDHEKQRSESLLFSILPQKIAKRLTQSRGTIAQQYPVTSILFADIANFTPLSEKLTPTELIMLLNEVFSEFDRLVEHYGVEKIKTIGDCYMVASGVPNPRPDHAQAIAFLAIDLIRYINNFAQKYRYPINLRIGIHSGTVVAGVIGQQKLMYDLWGDTVNTASRMESHGEVGKIQISRATYDLLGNEFICEPQGEIDVKGKGKLETWHLIAKREKVDCG
jgi:class 3 adenylate cyclase